MSWSERCAPWIGSPATKLATLAAPPDLRATPKCKNLWMNEVICGHVAGYVDRSLYKLLPELDWDEERCVPIRSSKESKITTDLFRFVFQISIENRNAFETHGQKDVIFGTAFSIKRVRDCDHLWTCGSNKGCGLWMNGSLCCILDCIFDDRREINCTKQRQTLRLRCCWEI